MPAGPPPNHEKATPRLPSPPRDPRPRSRSAALLLNLSTRVEIPPPFLGEDVTAVIGGFIIGGTKSRKILVRALGPSLADFGLVPLADPTLELYDGTGLLLASNDNWRDTQETEIIETSLPPTNGLESAIVMTLAPGTYTAIGAGMNRSRVCQCRRVARPWSSFTISARSSRRRSTTPAPAAPSTGPSPHDRRLHYRERG